MKSSPPLMCDYLNSNSETHHLFLANSFHLKWSGLKHEITIIFQNNSNMKASARILDTWQKNRKLWETRNTKDMRDTVENKMYFLERWETVTDLNRGLAMGGGVQLVGFTCHAPLQHCLHKNMLTASAEGEKDKRRRWKKGEDTQR